MKTKCELRKEAVLRAQLYYQNNKEKVKQYKKEWSKEYDKRPEVIAKKKENSKKYYLKNREEILKEKKIYWDLNKHIIKPKERNKRLIREYSITQEDYEKLLISQDYTCAICSTKHEENRNGLFIDHNHETGKIRQLLCLNCNTLLGHASDDIEILTKAIIYLNKHRETF